MNFRTDLALEAAEPHKNIIGLQIREQNYGKSSVTKMTIESDSAAKKIGKPKGNYITITVPVLTNCTDITDGRIKIIANEISKLIPKTGMILVAGLGNTDITPDALGPKVAENILATRHISSELIKSMGLESLRSVSVITPSVLGKTGIESYESILSIIKEIKPACVIIIDALASRNLSRLGRTIQISDSGISPGSGVGNARPLLDKSSLGIPVISIGVPTVVDASTLAYDMVSKTKNIDENIKNDILSQNDQMIVTPREIDLLIAKSAFLIGMAINCAIQPSLTPKEIHSLVS